MDALQLKAATPQHSEVLRERDALAIRVREMERRDPTRAQLARELADAKVQVAELRRKAVSAGAVDDRRQLKVCHIRLWRMITRTSFHGHHTYGVVHEYLTGFDAY